MNRFPLAMCVYYDSSIGCTPGIDMYLCNSCRVFKGCLPNDYGHSSYLFQRGILLSITTSGYSLFYRSMDQLLAIWYLLDDAGYAIVD